MQSGQSHPVASQTVAETAAHFEQIQVIDIHTEVVPEGGSIEHDLGVRPQAQPLLDAVLYVVTLKEHVVARRAAFEDLAVVPEAGLYLMRLDAVRREEEIDHF